MSRLSDEARLCAIGLLNIADDEGYFPADPGLIRSMLWPLDEDSLRAQRSINECSRVGWCKVVEHPTHGKIGRVVNFGKHQAICRPKSSKLRVYYSMIDHGSIIDESLLEQGTGNREQGESRARAREGSASPPGEDPEAAVGAGGGECDTAIPTAEEVITAGQLAGIPSDYCQHYWDWHDTNHRWLQGPRGREKVLKWRRDLCVWWAKDRATWIPGGGVNGQKKNGSDLGLRLKTVREGIAKHPANSDSIYSVAEPDAEQVADLKRLRELERSLERTIGGGS